MQSIFSVIKSLVYCFFSKYFWSQFLEKVLQWPLFWARKNRTFWTFNSVAHQFPTLKLFSRYPSGFGLQDIGRTQRKQCFRKRFSVLLLPRRLGAREKPRAAASGENRGKEKPHMSPLINKWHILQGLGTSNNKDQLILKMLSMWTSKEFSLIP